MHILANCITHFLSNLEEPVVPVCMRHTFLSAANCGNSVDVKELVSKLPPASQDTLRRICPHLLTITKIRGSNQTVHELATVFGPIIFGLCQEDEGYEQAINMVANMIQTIRFC